MHSALSVVNHSGKPISVYADGERLFSDIPGGSTTRFKSTSAGSIGIHILSGSEKKLFDLWLPFNPKKRHTLEIYPTFCIFI